MYRRIREEVHDSLTGCVKFYDEITSALKEALSPICELVRWILIRVFKLEKEVHVVEIPVDPRESKEQYSVRVEEILEKNDGLTTDEKQEIREWLLNRFTTDCS